MKAKRSETASYASTAVKKQFGRIEKTVGVLLVATGVAFLTGGFQSISLWLIETFPQFRQVGWGAGLSFGRAEGPTRNPESGPSRDGTAPRSGRFGELDRNAGGGDALQRGGADVGGLDAVDFKIETNDRVGVVFLRFADQRLDGRSRRSASAAAASTARQPADALMRPIE